MKAVLSQSMLMCLFATSSSLAQHLPPADGQPRERQTGAAGYFLNMTGQCPGHMSMSWSGAPPNTLQYLIYSRITGSGTIPSGVPGCANQPCDLIGSKPHGGLNPIATGGEGAGTLSGTINPSACGMFIQLVNNACATSNVEWVQ